MDRPTPRPIQRLLVANRGEIATRILSSARELGIETFAVYTSDDIAHTRGAAHNIKLKSPASYLNIQELVQVVLKHKIDAVHPGYGFLSESAHFSKKMWQVGVTVVGPGWGILDKTGDKLKAKLLADDCQVPTLPALTRPTSKVEDLKTFASETGYPIMIKAVDGGGGRGIRLTWSEEALEAAAKRAIEESPSKLVFAEKAAVNGYLHVEVQIIGDGKGDVRHLWERQCSIQRRYQKVVEIAPCISKNRRFIAQIIDSAVKMARKVNYFSLGTFEFLADPITEEYYFLEVNPRLQVEHTITESISSVDLVRVQLLLSQGASLSAAGLSEMLRDPAIPPSLYSCQLRITSENVQNDWSLSIGKIQNFQLPTGHGIRVDTSLVHGHQAIVGSDFDSLLAKLIITAPSWKEVVWKAQRALEDTKITGVKTNLDILRGIVAHPDFSEGDCDTGWLETNQKSLLENGERLSSSTSKTTLLDSQSATSSVAGGATSVPIFRKGDAWTISLAPTGDKTATAANHHLQVSRILRNEFPTSMSADILYATPSSPDPTPYTITMNSTSSSASAVTSQHRKGNPRDPRHVVIPFPGTLIEVLVDEGDMVKASDVICIVRQMKMELEVRASKAGKVAWIMEVEDGEEVAEGTLAAEIEVEERTSNIEAKL
ncbi:carbamoyl-phosphate synthase L chain ATP binding domain-containing protein [Venturia nashicola]|uniref:Carbamoyl-phosphate synthase L chain ATP binding domain-containing protein n=1 Tax=Venturia nashicola TaxID=86259 RepID=A0A4Z1PGR7_9PEZI|nr:carbamoyl-phosphate synthase L chain ATP binding domain-containing protein [Venturia nashicola]